MNIVDLELYQGVNTLFSCTLWGRGEEGRREEEGGGKEEGRRGGGEEGRRGGGEEGVY